jgi:hypothetical protein
MFSTKIRTSIIAFATSLGVGGLAVFPVVSQAAALKLCVPRKESNAILTTTHGHCKKGYKLTSLGTERGEGKRGPEGKQGPPGPEGKPGATGLTNSELGTLKSVLPHIKFIGAGIAGKPTIQFSAVNVQVVSGSGKTNALPNGMGNFVIGYDENPGGHEQTGSHNLVLGEEQTFISVGGIVAGHRNAIKGEDASVTGGEANTASGVEASISGGRKNTASGLFTSVVGGFGNTAAGSPGSSILGGKEVEAKNEFEPLL